MSNLVPENKSILVIGPAWIGDMIMAQALFKLIKHQQPSTSIDVLAPGWTLPLLARMPEVRKGILSPLGHGDLQLGKRYSLAKSLRHQYDQAIVLPCSFKSALTTLWAKIPLRTGWTGEWRYGLLNDVRRLDKLQYPRMVQQFAALGLPNKTPLPELEHYYPQLQVDDEQRSKTVQKFNINLESKIIALCPGAEFGPAKRWPIEHFAKVANEMLDRGWQVFLFGSTKDRDLAKELMLATDDKCLDLTGKTSLSEVIDILSLADAVISNDSGLMHIAAALNRPLVVIYGSSSPDFTPPLSKQVVMAHLNLKCSPCFKRQCPLQHLDCLKKMQPDLILSKLNSLVRHD